MSSALELLDIYHRLNEANRFAVLVYARFKWARQMMIPAPRISAHWVK